MFKPLLLSLSVLGVSFASTASADDFVILMEEGAFFPEITYLIPGDTVTFINKNDGTIEAISADSSWKTGQLAFDESYVLTVASETVLGFSFATNPEIMGSLSFELAPLGIVDDSLIVDEDGIAPDATN